MNAIGGKVMALLVVMLVAAGVEGGRTGETDTVKARIKAARQALKERKIPFKDSVFFQYVKQGNTEVVELFLDAGMSVNERVEKTGVSVLETAIEGGHPDMVALLVKRGAAPDTAAADGRPLFIKAIEAGRFDIVKILADAGANLNADMGHGMTYLATVASDTKADDKVEIIKQLLEVGADPNITGGPFKRTPLLLAVIASAETAARVLVENGADPNIADRNGMTPLYYATKNGMIGLVRIFLAHGADPNIAYKDGTTPLMIACRQGLVKTATLLLEAKAKVNLADRDGNRALMHVMWAPANHVKLVQLLLKHGAKVNVRNKRGFTPLRLAYKYGRQEAAYILVHAGAR